MTCIVGIASRGRVVLGGDSSVNAQEERSTCADPKVFRVGSIGFGIAGGFRAGDLLRHLADIPMPAGPVDKWARCELVPQLRKAARDHDVDWSECQALVAASGRLFLVESDWAVIEPAPLSRDGRRKERYAAIGSGSAWAQGCLYALDRESGLTLDQRVEEALRASAAWCSSVSAPFAVIEI